MAFKIADRVLETSTTTGTGTLTLAGAVTGYQSFAAIGNANTCYYCIEAVDGDGVPTGEWEVGIGTYTSSGTTLARTTVIYSSNSNSAVNLSAGTKRVFVTSISDYGNPIVMETTANRAIQVANQTALSSTAGNARGKGAIDLVIKRGNANQVASGDYSVNIGGRNTRASGEFSLAIGGYNNLASALGSVAFGTGSGTASGSRSIVCSYNSTASGSYSACLGGYAAKADKYGQIAHASGRFGAQGDAQASMFVLRNVTTNATPKELFLNQASLRMTLENNTCWKFLANVTAWRTDSKTTGAGWLMTGAITRTANAASTTLIGSITTIASELNAGAATWAVAITADTTNGSLKITVTGEAAKTIRWVARVDTVEVSG